jgi:hypothetical protein
MEKFMYRKGWILHKGMEIGYPSIPLIAFIGYAVIGLKLEFKWWVPIILIGFVGWLVYAVINFFKAIKFSVELTEHSIRAAGVEALWENINIIGFVNGAGDDPVVVMHQINGKSLYIPGATDGIEYIKGYIKGHAKNASFT